MTTAILEKKLKPLREPMKNRFMGFLLTNFPPQPIQSKAMYKHYSGAVRILLEVLETQKLAAADRDAVLKFVALVAPRIEEFEGRTEAVADPDPIELLGFLMEQHNLKQEDLAADLGGQSVVSDLINRKRKLNVDQIAKLSGRFHISPASFFPAAGLP